jgi:glucosamine--fructose-6-phosphate aminotransferase (isomerizing)
MCGIVGYIGERNCADVLLEGLSSLEYRGYDSAGIAIFENGAVKTVKSCGRLKNLREKLKLNGTPVGNCGIGHTRWATHGKPSDLNSHPHSGKKITVVHNGIIENYMSLKDSLEEKGYEFLSDTDTEVAAKLIDCYYHGEPLDAIKRALTRIRGSYAFGILFEDFPDRIYAVRKDSPLIVGAGEGENFIASDIPAILKYTRNYYLMEENEVAILTREGVTFSNLDGESIVKETLTATWDVSAAEKGGYRHFMLKEIYEQPKAIRDTISPRIINGNIVFEGLGDGNFKGIEKIYIVACGTAMHAGMVGKNAIETLARVPVEVDIASEFRYRDPILKANDLVIIISQSGETADTLAALRLARSRGVKTLAVVNVVGSSIAREADYVIYTWAGPEIAVASTKAYSVQLTVMYLLAAKIAFENAAIDKAQLEKLCEQLLKLPEAVGKMLEQQENCQHLASLYQNAHSLFFIGRGMDYAVSMEGSLKLKEISYLHSEAYAAGELKHGTISLIVDGTPVVAVATQKKLIEKTISNIKEVKARGARVLLVCRQGEKGADAADEFIELPDMPDIFMPSLAVVPLQMFAYYMAVLHGCDVDKPRNLAKSVTVE